MPGLCAGLFLPIRQPSPSRLPPPLAVALINPRAAHQRGVTRLAFQGFPRPSGGRPPSFAIALQSFGWPMTGGLGPLRGSGKGAWRRTLKPAGHPSPTCARSRQSAVG